jgi:Transposase IS116/IS110/IS902 family
MRSTTSLSTVPHVDGKKSDSVKTNVKKTPIRKASLAKTKWTEARFVGLTGTPDESGSRRRDRGLMKAGSARVRHIMIQLAWRMLYQPNATLVQWYRDRVAKANGAGRKTFIVALARKLLIALWRFVQSGEVPEGIRLATV